jgi:hypothetical protein
MPGRAFFLKWNLRESKKFILVERQDTVLEVSIRHELEKTGDRKGNCFPFDGMWADSNLKVLVRTMADGVTHCSCEEQPWHSKHSLEEWFSY